MREVEIARLPIGDWTVKPYGPYVCCMDGDADKIMWFMDTAAKYNIKISSTFMLKRAPRTALKTSVKLATSPGSTKIISVRKCRQLDGTIQPL